MQFTIDLYVEATVLIKKEVFLNKLEDVKLEAFWFSSVATAQDSLFFKMLFE